MQHRIGVDPPPAPIAADAGDATIVTICPSCAARARAFAQPQLRGVKVTSVVIFGGDGTESWTVLARRGGGVLATATGPSEEAALFDVLDKLGVLT